MGAEKTQQQNGQPISKEKAGTIKMFLGFSIVLFIVSLLVMIFMATGHIDKIQATTQAATARLQQRAAREAQRVAAVTAMQAGQQATAQGQRLARMQA